MRSDAEKMEIFDGALGEYKDRFLVIARFSAPGPDRHDLYQEILWEVWQSLDGWESRCSIGTWVMQVALNTANAFKRDEARRRRAGREIERHYAQAAAQVVQGPDAGRIIDDFMASLSARDRDIFLLLLNDAGYREMAELTGLKEPHLTCHLRIPPRVMGDR